MAIASILTIVALAFLPAIGPWTVFAIQPTQEQKIVQTTILGLRSAVQYPPLLTGAIVSFPSYRVVLALLAAAALWSFRKARLCIAIVTLLICVSTITTGWHYISDVIGGIALAVVSHRAALGLLAD